MSYHHFRYRRMGLSTGILRKRKKLSGNRKAALEVYSQKEAGNWEADTVISGWEKSKAYFAILAERKTRFHIAVKIHERKADTTAVAIVESLSVFLPELMKSTTCERGSEFANWKTIEQKLNCGVFLADPYWIWKNFALCFYIECLAIWIAKILTFLLYFCW